jgi:hypothetical protein
MITRTFISLIQNVLNKNQTNTCEGAVGGKLALVAAACTAAAAARMAADEMTDEAFNEASALDDIVD